MVVPDVAAELGRISLGAVAHLDRRAVQADELGVHGRVERAPVVPALGDRRPGRATPGTDPLLRRLRRIAAVQRRLVAVRAPVVDRPRDAEVHFGERSLVRVDPALVPLQPEVVVDARVVRLRRRLDEGRSDVAVQVERLGRVVLLHDRDGGLGLRLRLGQEVAVEVEPVAVRARAGHAAVRVLDHVEDDDPSVEDLVDLGVGPVGGRGELLDQAHIGVDAFVLVAVDGALDVQRHLDVVTPEGELGLRPRGFGQHPLAELRPAPVRLLLRPGRQLVDHDLVERAARRRLARHLDRHPAVEAARLDVVQGALDRVDGDVREARCCLRRRQRPATRRSPACRTTAVRSRPTPATIRSVRRSGPLRAVKMRCRFGAPQNPPLG